MGGYGLEDELETDTESEPESETETEDGFTDVYETPLERARAALYAGHTGYSNGHGGFAEGGVF